VPVQLAQGDVHGTQTEPLGTEPAGHWLRQVCVAGLRYSLAGQDVHRVTEPAQDEHAGSQSTQIDEVADSSVPVGHDW